MADDRLLLKQHADVLFRMDGGERLVGVNEPEGGPAPRLFLARGRTSTQIWFRADVSPARRGGVPSHRGRPPIVGWTDADDRPSTTRSARRSRRTIRSRLR